jgi:hypothetical protein
VLRGLRAVGFSVLMALFPGLGSAATLSPTNTVMTGGTYDINAGPYFFGVDLFASDGAGSFSFTFENNSVADQTLAISIGTVLQGFLRFVDGVTVAWANGDDIFIPAAPVGDYSTSTFALKSLIQAGSFDVLTVTYGDPTGGLQSVGNIDLVINDVISPVPLPAGGLLLLTALGGVIALRRRKSTDA